MSAEKLQQLRAYWLANVPLDTRVQLAPRYAILYVMCTIGDDAVAEQTLANMDLSPDQEEHREAMLAIMRA